MEFKENKGIISMTRDTLNIPVDWEIRELRSKFITLKECLVTILISEDIEQTNLLFILFRQQSLQ